MHSPPAASSSTADSTFCWAVDPARRLRIPLVKTAEAFTTRVSVHLPAATLDEERISSLRDVVQRHPGSIPLVLCLQYPGGEKVFLDTNRTFRVEPSADLLQDVERLLGEQSVYIAVNPSPTRKPPNERNGRRNGARRAPAGAAR